MTEKHRLRRGTYVTLKTNMYPVKFFNNLLLMENFFGIYRNYSNQKKSKKCFIIFLIFVQTMLQTIIVIYELNLLLREANYNPINLFLAGFSVSAYTLSVSSVTTAILCSRAFVSYYSSISRVSEYFKDDKKLMNSVKKTYWFSIGFILYSIAFIVIRSVDTFVKFSELSPLILVPMLVSQAITKITIVLQHLMLYAVVMIVVYLLKCLTSLISAVQERVVSCDISSDEQCDITREQIQGWIEGYRDLANCCDKVMHCFGRQFFFLIILSTLHYIFMSYNFFSTNILKIGNTKDYTKVLIVLFGYVSVMMLQLVARQIAKNQGVKFHRVLARLYNAMIIDSGEAEAKLVKDFIRLIKKNPIEIKILSNITAGMYILPVILTVVVNQLIVMLQFNHVI